jgi:hypothetical protein
MASGTHAFVGGVEALQPDCPLDVHPIENKYDLCCR